MKKILIFSYLYFLCSILLSQHKTQILSLHWAGGRANTYSNYPYKDNPYMQPVELYIPQPVPIWDMGIRYINRNPNKFGNEFNIEWAKRGSYRSMGNWKVDLRYINFSMSANYFLYPIRSVFTFGTYISRIQKLKITADDWRAAAKTESTINFLDIGLCTGIHQQIFKIDAIICTLDLQGSYGILGLYKTSLFKNHPTHNVSLSGGLSLGYTWNRK